MPARLALVLIEAGNTSGDKWLSKSHLYAQDSNQ